MADTTTDTPIDGHDDAVLEDAENLAGAVDALIDEIDGVCEAFDRSQAEDDPSPASTRDEAAPAATADSAQSALDAEVDALVAEVSGAGATEADETPPVVAPAESIDDLDAELAAVADEELAGDFDTLDDLSAVAPAPPESEAAESDDAPDDEDPAAAATPVAEPAPTPEPQAVQEVDLSTPDDDFTEADDGAQSRAAAVWAFVEPSLRLLSLPLLRLTRVQRDTVGWLALNTLFLAFCVWLFVLLR